MSPLPTEVKKETGPDGLGSITFTDERILVRRADGQEWHLPPDGVAPWLEGTARDHQECFFQLNRDETQLRTVNPWESTEIVRFNKFVPRNEDDEPMFKVKPGGMRSNRDGGTYYAPERPYMGALMTVIDGEFEGYDLYYFLDYLFEPWDNGLAKIRTTRPSWANRLENFLDIAGFDRQQDDIPYSTNCLPALEQILQERADENLMLATVKEGGIAWENGLTRLPTGLRPNVQPA